MQVFAQAEERPADQRPSRRPGQHFAHHLQPIRLQERIEEQNDVVGYPDSIEVTDNSVGYEENLPAQLHVGLGLNLDAQAMFQHDVLRKRLERARRVGISSQSARTSETS